VLKFKGDDLPVEQITYEDAQTFIEKLSIKTGHTYRLPSEAEWEYAALAGQQSVYPSGESAAGLSRLAWFKVTTDKTEPVGTRQGNKFGLFDMYGNVAEWTEDCFNSNFNNAPTNGEAWRDGSCQFGVVRGGSWVNTANFLRSKNREKVSKKAKGDDLGFRVVRDFIK
jgi:formylglycine-generating enzyme required for sulfatase activity